MKRALVAVPLVGACMARGSGDAGAPLHDDPPVITDAEGDCSADDETWTVEVRTDAWTAGGALWMATTLDEVESFTLRSAGAAADGSADTLRATLSIVADPQDAGAGSATARPCTPSIQATIAFRAEVYSPGTEAVSDCLDFGPVTDLFDQSPDMDPCPRDAAPADSGS